MFASLTMGACLSSPTPSGTESGNAKPPADEPSGLDASEAAFLLSWRENDAKLGKHWAGDEPPEYWRGVTTNGANVRDLNLPGIGLSSIPSDISRLSKLEVLDLAENGLSGPLPQALGSLPELRELRLEENGFSGGLPEEWENLAKLTHLNLSGSPLTMPEGLPAKLLAKLTSMEDLQFSGAKIPKVPYHVCCMKDLSVLVMSDCGVTTIDDAIAECEALAIVIFSGNLLETVPRGLCDLRQLSILDFSNNPNLKTVSSEFEELEFKVQGQLRMEFDDHVEFEEEEEAADFDLME